VTQHHLMQLAEHGVAPASKVAIYYLPQLVRQLHKLETEHKTSEHEV